MGPIKALKHLLASRRAVKGVQGEAKIERLNGHAAPPQKHPFITFRLLARPALVMVIAYVYTRFPVVESVLGEADTVVDLALGAWFIYLCRTVPSDLLRLSPRVGLPDRGADNPPGSGP